MASPARFMLVHGAFHGAWCWDGVANVLRQYGHQVMVPTLAGVGERADELSADTDLNVMIDDLTTEIVNSGWHDVVLVGHSFAGAVITGVADRIADRLARLVYLDAVWVEDGQAPIDVVPADVAANRYELSEAHDGGLSLPPLPPEAFGITDAANRALLLDKLTPHPMASFTSKISLKQPVTNGVPAHYVVCTAPVYTTLGACRRRAEDMGIPVTEIAGPHDVMLTHPAATAELLMSLSAT